MSSYVDKGLSVVFLPPLDPTCSNVSNYRLVRGNKCVSDLDDQILLDPLFRPTFPFWSINFFLPIRSEDDYSEEEEEDEDDDDDDEDEEEDDEYDGEIPQPELEPRSRRCLVGDAGVCVIPGGNSCEEEEDEQEEHDMHGQDSDSDGPVLYKDDDSEEEEDEPPLSKHPPVAINGTWVSVNLCPTSRCLSVLQARWPAE